MFIVVLSLPSGVSADGSLHESSFQPFNIFGSVYAYFTWFIHNYSVNLTQLYIVFVRCKRKVVSFPRRFHLTGFSRMNHPCTDLTSRVDGAQTRF